jgi:hypothetical protein
MQAKFCEIIESVEFHDMVDFFFYYILNITLIFSRPPEPHPMVSSLVPPSIPQYQNYQPSALLSSENK